MSNDPNHANQPANGGYERSDIGIAGVLYFLLGLAVAMVITYFIVDGLYAYLDKSSKAQNPPVSPLIENAPADTRHVPRDYPQTAFPSPRLEEDERGQLNGIRLKEEDTLSTYDYIDKNAGTVRIPIDRAMDLIAQRGLPVRVQNDAAAPPASESPKPEATEKKKGSKK
jgi:hypothetical protein